MARYAIKRINECSVEEKNTLDNFILDGKTNGEFLNSIRYLSYHPVGRFLDDSIAVMDVESNSVRGVMMAASKCGEKIPLSHIRERLSQDRFCAEIVRLLKKKQ